jgi:hypothetical protein
MIVNYTGTQKRKRRLPFNKAHIVAVLMEINASGMMHEELLGALARRVAMDDYHRQRYAEWVVGEYLQSLVDRCAN